MWGDFYMVVIPLLAGYVLDSFLETPAVYPIRLSLSVV